MNENHLGFSRRRLALGVGAAMALIGGLPPAGHAARLRPIARAIQEGPSPLGELLAMVPQAITRASTAYGILWQFDDLARQFAACGIDHPSEAQPLGDVDVTAASHALTLASSAFGNADDAGFRAALGFNPFAMKHVLVAGPPLARATLFRGDFDSSRLIAAWLAAGFEEVFTVNGVTAWSIGVAGQILPEHPLQSNRGVEFNNVTIIDDVVIWAPMLSVLDLITDHLASPRASALEDPTTQESIGSLPSETVAAIGLPPEAITLPDHLAPADVEPELLPIREVIGPMPPLQGVVAAVAEGARMIDDQPSGRNAGKAFLRLQFDSLSKAGQAVAVVAQRWSKLDSPLVGEPYASLMTMDTAGSIESMAAFDFTQARSPAVWRDLLLAHDILPLLPDSSNGQPPNWA